MRQTSFLRSGSPLAVATVVSGLLTYAFNVILSRALGPQLYGSVGALLAVAVIATVPATALQLELARLVASGTITTRAGLLRLTTAVSAGTMIVALLLVPVLNRVLRLESMADALMLALMLFPQTFTGGILGMLLGHHRMSAFAMVLIAMGASRFLAAVATLVVSGGTTFALAGAAIGLAVAAILGLWLLWTNTPSRSGERPAPAASDLARGLLRASGAAAALMTLLNVDLVLARVVLNDHDSGLYAFATVFGRITFWGTGFLSLWVYPRVASGGQVHRAIRLALFLISAVGGVALAGSFVAGGLISRVLAGAEYVTAGRYAPWFAAAGALMATVQFAVYVDVARARTRLVLYAWGAAVALLAILLLLSSPTIGSVVGADVGVLAVLSLAALVTLRTRPRAPGGPIVDTPLAAPQ